MRYYIRHRPKLGLIELWEVVGNGSWSLAFRGITIEEAEWRRPRKPIKFAREEGQRWWWQHEAREVTEEEAAMILIGSRFLLSG